MAVQPEDQNQVYYRQFYQFPSRSHWMERIWAEAFGENYPAGLEHYGYLTQYDLAQMSGKLDLSPGSTMLDIGCGKGGPGLRIAQDLKLRLIGMDIIPEAIAQAEIFQKSFDLAYPAQFQVGEFYQIPLPDQSVDAVICIDALWAAPNKVQALLEIKRVMKPGAKCIFTYWDLHSIDALPYFEATGLSLISRADTPNWQEYQHKVYEGIVKYQDELVEEMGECANMLLYEAQASPAYLDLSVRRLYEMVLKAEQ